MKRRDQRRKGREDVPVASIMVHGVPFKALEKCEKQPAYTDRHDFTVRRRSGEKTDEKGGGNGRCCNVF